MVRKSPHGREFDPGLENCLCQPRRKWVSVPNQGSIRQQKEWDELRLSNSGFQDTVGHNPSLTLRPLGYKKALPLIRSPVRKYRERSSVLLSL